LKIIRDKVNEYRASLGRDPIPYLENYFPAIWLGDYRIWVKDKAGNNVGAYAFKNEIQANFAHRFISKEHPDLIAY